MSIAIQMEVTQAYVGLLIKIHLLIASMRRKISYNARQDRQSKILSVLIMHPNNSLADKKPTPVSSIQSETIRSDPGNSLEQKVIPSQPVFQEFF